MNAVELIESAIMHSNAQSNQLNLPDRVLELIHEEMNFNDWEGKRYAQRLIIRCLSDKTVLILQYYHLPHLPTEAEKLEGKMYIYNQAVLAMMLHGLHGIGNLIDSTRERRQREANRHNMYRNQAPENKLSGQSPDKLLNT